MTQTVGVRAASVMTSAALLGILVAGALSVSITLQASTTDAPIISVPLLERPPEPPPPPPPRPRETPPPQQPLRDESALDLPPISPLEPDAPPQTTTIAFPGPSEITNPRWLRQPRDLARYYPARALARELPGVVSLDCLVDLNGALHCSVLSETPIGWGFGDAALRISRDYRMVPAMRDGRAVEGRYRMRVPFEVR
ncbi:MAG: energy transducer TonB [Hyphomonadaceae bacterium]